MEHYLDSFVFDRVTVSTPFSKCARPIRTGGPAHLDARSYPPWRGKA